MKNKFSVGKFWTSFQKKKKKTKKVLIEVGHTPK